MSRDGDFNDKDFDREGSRALRAIERRLEKTRDKAEASQALLNKFHEEVVKNNDHIREKLISETTAGIAGKTTNALMDRFLQISKGGNSLSGAQDFENFGNENNCPTGEEKAPWERDDI